MSGMRHYFINANSCEGFTSYFKSNFYPLHLSVKLEDYPAELLKKVTQQVIQRAVRDGFTVDVLHNCLDDTVEGVILPQFGTGMLNIPAYIDYGYSVQKLLDDPAVEQTKAHLIKAHHYFAEAKTIHDEWENYYIAHTEYGTLNQFTREFIQNLLGGCTQNRRGKAVHRFFGAAAEDGPVDYVENLTTGIRRRYFIKGRPGTGKSTFLKKIAQRAVNNGFLAEVYHCAFDPSSLDMVILPELDLCFFDSTKPHEHLPQHQEDTVLDLYAIAVKDGTDERYAEQLEDCAVRYQAQMKQAQLEIAAANQIRLERESMIHSKINSDRAEAVIQKVIKKLFVGASNVS